MTSSRFLLQASDYDLAYEFRVADLTRVDKTKEDFWNEEVEVYEYLEYLNYLYMNGAFLTMEEANEIFNGLHEENEELRHKLSQQEMEYVTTAYKQAEENEQLRSDLKSIQKEAISNSDLNKWIEKKMDHYERIMKKTEGSNYVNARGHLDMLIMLKEWIKQR